MDNNIVKKTDTRRVDLLKEDRTKWKEFAKTKMAVTVKSGDANS